MLQFPLLVINSLNKTEIHIIFSFGMFLSSKGSYLLNLCIFCPVDVVACGGRITSPCISFKCR